jgi:hypothetical protein
MKVYRTREHKLYAHLGSMPDGSVKVTPAPTLIDQRRTPSEKARFPQPNEAHARNALARLSHAEKLTPEQRRIVAQRAANILGEVTPGAMKYGVTGLTTSPTQAISQRPIVIGGRKPIRARRITLD